MRILTTLPAALQAIDLSLGYISIPKEVNHGEERSMYSAEIGCIVEERNYVNMNAFGNVSKGSER